MVRWGASLERQVEGADRRALSGRSPDPGLCPEQRHILRHDQSKPIIDGLRTWLDVQLAKVPATLAGRGHPQAARLTRSASVDPSG
jgi:hypothetical protein